MFKKITDFIVPVSDEMQFRKFKTSSGFRYFVLCNVYRPTQAVIDFASDKEPGKWFIAVGSPLVYESGLHVWEVVQ